MKRIVMLFLTVFMVVSSITVASAQGLYEKTSNEEETTTTASGFYNNDPDLKLPGDGGTSPVPTSPVSDGFWILLGIAGIYGVFSYRNFKRSKVSE